jgi:hypothetical protein
MHPDAVVTFAAAAMGRLESDSFGYSSPLAQIRYYLASKIAGSARLFGATG